MPKKQDGDLLGGVAHHTKRVRRVEAGNRPKRVEGHPLLRVDAAARQYGISDAGGDGVQKGFRNGARLHPGEGAVRRGFHEVVPVDAAVFPRRAGSGSQQHGGKIRIRLCAKVRVKDAVNGFHVLRAELPEPHVFPAAPGLRVRHVEHIFQAGSVPALIQKGDPFCAALYPAFEPVPHGNGGAGRGVRALGVDEDLIVHAVFIHLRGGIQKRHPVFRAFGYLQRRLFKKS
ncbi:MAG: hypothetical protein ABF449_11430 [Ethanoligenens sp.]